MKFLKIKLSLVALLVVVGVFSSFATAPAVVKKPKVERSLVIQETAQLVWDRLKTFDNVEAYLPQVIKETQMKNTRVGKGAKRVCVTMDNNTADETVIQFSNKKMYMKYKVENSPWPMVLYNSTQVVDLGNGSCKVIWTSDFKAESPEAEKEIAMKIGGFLDMALQGLSKLYSM